MTWYHLVGKVSPGRKVSPGSPLMDIWAVAVYERPDQRYPSSVKAPHIPNLQKTISVDS